MFILIILTPRIDIGTKVRSGTRTGRVICTEQQGLQAGWVEVEWQSGEWTTEPVNSLELAP